MGAFGVDMGQQEQMRANEFGDGLVATSSHLSCYYYRLLRSLSPLVLIIDVQSIVGMERGKRGATLGSFLLFLRARCVLGAAMHEYSLLNRTRARNLQVHWRCAC